MTRRMRMERQRGRLPLPLLIPAAILLVLAALLALVLFAPAGAVAMVLERSGAEVRLATASGRIHRGSAQVLLGRENLGRLHWRLEPSGLLRGSLSYALELEAPDHRASARARLSPSGASMEALEGVVEERGLRALLAPYDIHPSGRLTFTSGRAHVNRHGLEAVNGDAHWTGGFVRYFLAGQGWTTEFPPLDARLRLEDERPVLVVLDPQGDALLDLRLELDGWAHLRIRYRFIALAGFPWPDGPPPDRILIELSERVF